MPFPIALNLRHPKLALTPRLHAKHALPNPHTKQFPRPTLHTAGLATSVKHIGNTLPRFLHSNPAGHKHRTHQDVTPRTAHSANPPPAPHGHSTGPGNILTHLGAQEQGLTQSSRSAHPSRMSSVLKHLQAWPRANTGQGPRPAEPSADHQATFTAGATRSPAPWIRAQHELGGLWPHLPPNPVSLGSIQACASYSTHLHSGRPSPQPTPVRPGSAPLLKARTGEFG